MKINEEERAVKNDAEHEWNDRTNTNIPKYTMKFNIGRQFFSKKDNLVSEFQAESLAIQDTPATPFTRIILWTLAVLVVVVIILSYFSRIPIMTSASGKFSVLGRTKVIQSLNTGNVYKIMVKTGEHVAKGQILVELNNSVNKTVLSSRNNMIYLNNLEKKRILTEINGTSKSENIFSNHDNSPMMLMERNMIKNEVNNARSELAYDRAKISEDTSSLAVEKEKLKEYVIRANADKSVLKQAVTLFKTGAISGYHLHQLQDHYTHSQGRLDAQYKRVEQLKYTVTAADRKLVQDKTAIMKKMYEQWQHDLTEEYNLSRKHIIAEEKDHRDWLRSPVNGVVQTLDVASLGAVIQAGQTVATVVPDNAPLFVDADIPSQDMGFIKKNQKVDIKVSAFPFEQYGMIKGRVTNISPTADTTNSIMSSPPGESHQAAQGDQPSSSATNNNQTQGNSSVPPTLYYQAKITPDHSWLLVNGNKRKMEPGMTVTVDIRTGKRSVLGFFLAPFTKYISAGLYTQ